MNALFAKLTALTAAASEGVTEAADSFTFEPMAFVANLKYMAAGMVGIFIVIGAIILTIVLLGKLTAPKKGKEEKE